MEIKASKKLMFFLAAAGVFAVTALHASVRIARAQSECYDPSISYTELCGGSYTSDDDPGTDHPWWYKSGSAGCNAEGTYVGWRAKCRYMRWGDGFRCVEFLAEQVTEPNASVCAGNPPGPGTSGGNIEEHLGGWPFSDIGKVIASFLQVATIVAGLLLLVYLILGGIKYITAGGDEKSITSAKGMITSAAIGMIIIVGAYAITAIVEKVFGVKIISGITLPRP